MPTISMRFDRPEPEPLPVTKCVANRAFHRLILAGANPYSAAVGPVLLRTR